LAKGKVNSYIGKNPQKGSCWIDPLERLTLKIGYNNVLSNQYLDICQVFLLNGLVKSYLPWSDYTNASFT